MMTLKQAKAHAQAMTEMHGEPWLVFKTPAAAPCNTKPFSTYNQGRYAVCRASERADYEAGGAVFQDGDAAEAR